MIFIKLNKWVKFLYHHLHFLIKSIEIIQIPYKKSTGLSYFKLFADLFTIKPFIYTSFNITKQNSHFRHFNFFINILVAIIKHIGIVYHRVKKESFEHNIFSKKEHQIRTEFLRYYINNLAINYLSHKFL